MLRRGARLLLTRPTIKTQYQPVRRFAQTTFRPPGSIGPNPSANSQSLKHLIQNLDQGGIGAASDSNRGVGFTIDDYDTRHLIRVGIRVVRKYYKFLFYVAYRYLINLLDTYKGYLALGLLYLIL